MEIGFTNLCLLNLVQSLGSLTSTTDGEESLDAWISPASCDGEVLGQREWNQLVRGGIDLRKRVHHVILKCEVEALCRRPGGPVARYDRAGVDVAAACSSGIIAVDQCKDMGHEHKNGQD